MKCTKCFTENDNNAKFCKKCGNPLTGNEAFPDERFKDRKKPKTAEFLREIKKHYKLVFCIVLAVLLIGVYAFMNRKPTINLDQYVDVEIKGYDGYGTAKIQVDWGAIDEKYGNLMFDQNALGRETDDLTSRFVMYDALEKSVIPSLDKTAGLSNGDEITYSWNVSLEAFKEKLNCNLVYKEQTLVVENLIPTQKIDLYALFKEPYVVFDGSNGHTIATINLNLEKGTELYRDEQIIIIYNGKDWYYHTASVIKDNSEICEIIFKLSDSYFLSNGDRIMLYVDDIDALLEMGYAPLEGAIYYTVENRAEALTSKESIDIDKVVQFVQGLVPENSGSYKYSDLEINAIYYVAAKDTTVTDRTSYIFIDYSYTSEYCAWGCWVTNHNNYCEISSYYYENEQFKCDEMIDRGFVSYYEPSDALSYIEKYSKEYDFIKLY